MKPKQRDFGNKVKQKIKSVGDPRITSIPAIAGNGRGVLNVPEKPGFIYALARKGIPYVVLNKAGDIPLGATIEIGTTLDDQTLRVLKVHQVWNNKLIEKPALHGEDHSYGGRDPVAMWLANFMWWKVEPLTGFTVKIYRNAFKTDMDVILPPGSEELDLTSHVPASGAIYVLIEILEDGTLNVLDGSDVGYRENLTAADIPTPTANARRLYAVSLYNGQTELSITKQWNDFYDLRLVDMGTGGGGGGGTVESVTGDGVDNTDPANPVISWPTAGDIGALTSANIEDAINNGVTDKAPSENAVFDALATKLTSANIEDAINNGVTDKAPSENAVFDALALKQDAGAAAGGDLAGTYPNPTITNASVIAKVLTGFTAGAGTVSAADSILSAFQKVVGNIALKLTANAPITGATKTKITYDPNGLVTAGADATTADIADSTDKRYVTDAQQTVIGNTSGSNSGDVTLAGTPNYITIAGQVITRTLIALTHMADVATATVFYRKTAGTGAPEVQTLATLITDIRATLDAVYAATAKGVTNGDSHDHVGGDGAVLKFYIPIPGHGNSGTIAASTTMYCPPFNYGLNTLRINFSLPRGGNIKNLRWNTNSAQPASGSLVLNVNVNNADSTLTATVAAGGAAQQVSDLTHVVAVSAGDALTFKLVNNATGTSGQVGGVTIELEIPTGA